MKKTYCVCDICEKEVMDNKLYDSKLGEVCGKCFDKTNVLYDKALEDLERRHGFVVKNKLAILNLLLMVKREEWKHLFGTNGIEIMDEIVREFKPQNA